MPGVSVERGKLAKPLSRRVREAPDNQATPCARFVADRNGSLLRGLDLQVIRYRKHIWDAVGLEARYVLVCFAGYETLERDMAIFDNDVNRLKIPDAISLKRGLRINFPVLCKANLIIHGAVGKDFDLIVHFLDALYVLYGRLCIGFDGGIHNLPFQGDRVPIDRVLEIVENCVPRQQ